MFTPNVAPGVHRIEDSYVNWYIVEEDEGLTIVDAGLPASWDSLQMALTQLGRSLSDIKAIVLTHAHFDHVGFAERARTKLGIPVYAHEEERPITKHPLSYEHEKSRLYYAWRPACSAAMASFVWWGMLSSEPIKSINAYKDGDTLSVPGRPQVVFSPGHTIGHSALFLSDRNVLFAGDAFVLLDPYTGRTGPRVVARGATAHSDQAKHSLNRLRATDAQIVLTGHGQPWTHGIAAAVDQAQQAPVA
ncbi:MAG TPA: MBL fold metallo-hydrolase [Tepidisphaeraceae bacterium]|jgi:glyoxylase-like metal-dependent hydrolase (beta-lactamase superfamily II)|nr:MBL fold metallo-hydrolase [Tepidisphaeraceae bacterium]